MGKNVCIVGAGYVGLVTGACLTELGHNVICVDNDKKKLAILNKGGVPIYEPGLDDLLKKHKKSGRLEFSDSIPDGMASAEVVFIAVNTPPLSNGEADLSYVEAVARTVAQNMKHYLVIAEKSTVPVETGDKIKQTVKLYCRSGIEFDVASNPEFLREGAAVHDFLNPDRVVIGVESSRAEKIMRELYAGIKAPVIVTDIKSAELIKHASNSFLATKISYINAVANICERVGANISKVAEGMGLDKRIGRNFLNAGLGFGGSCFPKDISAFIKMAERAGYNFELLRTVKKINDDQRNAAIEKLIHAIWTLKDKTIAVLGLAFKPETDDIRNSPAIEIVKHLLAEGAKIKAYDPKAESKAKSVLPGVSFCPTVYDAVRGADAVLLATEWDEFAEMDLAKIKKLMRTPVIVDGRNMLDPVNMRALGFTYTGFGQ